MIKGARMGWVFYRCMCGATLSLNNSLMTPIMANPGSQRSLFTRIVHLNSARLLCSSRHDGSIQIKTPSDVVDDPEGQVTSQKESPSSAEYFRKLLTDTASQSTDLAPNVSKVQKVKLSDLENIRPHLPTKSGNLATYVNDSETLTKLVQLGVNLSVVEKNQAVANHLLKVDFDTNIRIYLEFLHKITVATNDFGQIITRSPSLLLEDLDDLQVRINYLKSKRFEQSSIAKIVTRAPKILSNSVKETDLHLGYIQKTFKLTGNEMRDIVTRYPKLSIWPTRSIEDVRFAMKEFLGFSMSEIKQLLIGQPKTFTVYHKVIAERFDYLHNEIGLSHSEICEWPSVFRVRLFVVKQRHNFLKTLGRDQFDKTKENFVSMKALTSGSDVEFSENVAKVPVQEFNNFLKTL